jgi:hypothetical protein
MIFVHIGLNKAASSTLQRFLSRNEELLNRLGFTYPVDGLDHYKPDVVKTHNALGREIAAGLIGGNWRKVLDRLATLRDGESAILSGEQFCLHPPEPLRAALARFEVRIIVYLRDIGQLLASRYMHGTNSGINKMDFDLWYDRHVHRRNYKFVDYLGPWRNVFGADAIYVNILDASVLTGGDIRLDFLHALGVGSDDIEAARPHLGDSINEALGWKATELLRHLNPAAVGRTSPRRKPFRELHGSARQIEAALGLRESVSYLNAAQIEHTSEAFRYQVEALRASGMRMGFSTFEPQPAVVRRFLPTHEKIPDAERRRLVEALRADANWDAAMSVGS